MANATSQYIDPNIFLQTASAGTAQSPADRSAAVWAKIFAAANQAPISFETLDTNATTLDNTVYESRLAISGTMAFTLADGTYTGQRKRVVCTSAASIPVGTLTVTTPESASGFVCAGAFAFDTVGQAITFQWTGTKWRAILVERAGGAVDGVVIGTTVLTAKNLWQNYYCSVSGSVSSTTTKGIPDGSAIGEQLAVRVSTAISIPSGTISFTGLTNIGGAATTLGTMGATTNYAVLRWSGLAWQVMANATLVAS